MSKVLGVLKTQEHLMLSKIQVAETLIKVVSVMRKTKARSAFMLNKPLALKIY